MRKIPEGCLLLWSTASKTSEVHPVLMEGHTYKFFCLFRRETSSTNLYKPSENPISDFMKNRHVDHRKPVRYVLHEPNNTRPKHSKGHINFYVNPLGFIINLKKSALPATQKLEFLGLEIGSVNVDL